MNLGRGTRLGPYEITAPLGAGGMGEVYRARDTRLGRDVAIKVLPSAFAVDRERARRFAQEARAASALNHPNILSVFDVGLENGTPYLVSELLEGRTLRAFLDREALSPARAVDFARQIADGLAAIHRGGMAHRDIKPENLFVTADRRIKILDFGLARQPAPDDGTRITVPDGLTAVGALIGTPGYMSPEQVRGAPADARSDIFAFGAVLYEMAGGTRAFKGDSTVATMRAVLEDDPPALPAATLRAAPALAWIVGRCLEKEPDARFQSAHDLGLVLRSISTDSSAAALLPTRPAQRPRLRRAAPWLAVAVVAALAGAIAHARLAAVPSVDPPAIEALTFSGHDSSPAASPDGKTVAFMSDRDHVPRIWLKQVAGGGEVALTQGPDDFPRFSPDGSVILFVRTAGDRSSLYRVSPLGGEARKLMDDVSGADWSPDGRRLAFTRWVSGRRSGSIVGIADANGSAPREVGFVPGRALITPRWSPDGRTIAAVNGLADVVTSFGIDLVAADGSGTRRLLPPHGNMRESSVVWSADSRAVIYSEAESLAAWLSGSRARIVRQDVTTGSARTILWVPNHSQTLDVLGEGRLLLDTRSSRENLREFPLDSRDAPRWLTRGTSTDRQPVYSPDGRWVTFSSNRGGNLDLWSVSCENGIVRRLTDDAADDWDVAYSPDGTRLLWGSNRTGPYEVWSASPDGTEPRQLSHDGAFAQNPGETRGSQWVLYASTNPKHPGLWRMRADGADPVRIVDAVLELPDISPDGRHALYVDGLASRIRVVGLPGGTPVPFEIAFTERKSTTAILGRARWMPDGRAIAFVGQDESGVNGVFVQDFVPGRDTTGTRRKLGGFDVENAAESFAVSPDGRRMTVAAWEQLFNVVLASNVPGIERPPTR